MRLGCGANQKAIANVTRTRCDTDEQWRPSKCWPGEKYRVARVAEAASGVWYKSWSSRDHGEQAADGQSALRWDARVGCALSSHRTSDVPVSERMRDWRADARWLQSGRALQQWFLRCSREGDGME